jgi:choline dehydrogenase-like flavoprotein
MSAIDSSGLEPIREGRVHDGDLELDADVVVVGSGAGGAVVATELAEAGHRVIVLDEGPHVPLEQYKSMRPSEHLRRVWRDGGMTVALGVGGSPTINVTMGRCIGGSSMLTGGVCFRTPDHVLDVWSRERGLTELTPRGLEAAFESVERAIHVEEVPLSMRSRSTELFAEGARAKGFELKSLRRNTRGCNGCGRCNFGCPHGAKMSVDLSYLPRARRAGAMIWSDCLVDSITIEGGRATGVVGRLIGRDPPGLFRRPPTRRLRVRAKRVVCAAGAYHSPLLLMRSGLGKRSPALGRNMTVHPAFRMFARFDEEVRGWRGALQSAYTDHFESEGITMVGLFVPAGVLAATMPGFGPDHVRRAALVPHLSVFGGMIHDEGGGVVRRGPGREPLVTYRMSARDRARIPRVVELMAEIFFAAGAREVFPPILGQGGVSADELHKLDVARVPPTMIECSSQHPLGSCRMGAEPNDSVVDPNGQTWEVENLTVADGSVIPTSLGVNPQLSIMAMATRIAWKLRDEMRRR